MHGEAGGLQFGLEDRLDFLNHDDRVGRLHQRRHLLQRPGIGQAELQHRRVGKGFAHVHVGRATGDEGDAAIATGLQHVERRQVGEALQLLLALQHQRDAPLGVAGHHHPALGVFGETLRLVFDALADGDQALDVADARGQAQDHRHLVFLRQFEGVARHVVGFLRVGRLEHGHVGEAAPEARVLLVLRGRHADIVGHGDHQAALDAGQCQRHQRIGGDVQADVLHGAEGARTHHGGADGHFQRHLLVHRPLGVHVRIGGQHFQHLGRGRARITGGNPGARLPHRTGHRFVARHQ